MFIMVNNLDPGFEQYMRTTIPQRIADDPEQLYDLGVFASLSALDLSYHYSGKHIGVSMPIFGSTEGQLFTDLVPKMVYAGSYKPTKELHPDDAYTRVCAEQNLIDNGLVVGDIHMGVLFLRSRFILEDVEGSKDAQAPSLCQPCRIRTLPVFKKSLVVVSFVGESLEPVQAVTLGAMVRHQDLEETLQTEAEGPEVKDFVVNRVLSDACKQRRVEHLPRFPSRRYQRRQG